MDSLPTPPVPHLSSLAILIALSGILLFGGLGSVGLTDRDEGRNAEAGREMFETGDWITPTFNYEPRFYKPAFVYWLMTASYHLFGTNEFAARFHSALFGMALILLQYWFTARWQNEQVALLSSLMLLLNCEIIFLNRMALTDSVLVFFTTAAQWGLWAGLHSTGRGRHWFWVFYAGMAFATLTKGPVGFIIPLLTMSLYLSLTRRWTGYWHRGFPLLGLGAFIALTLPWYATLLWINGLAYVTVAKAHTVGRFMAPMEGHSFGLFFYFPVLLLGFFPWSGLLPMAMYEAVQGWRSLRRRFDASLPHRQDIEPGSDEVQLFATVWIIGAFAFFTLSATRLQHYIAPLFPAAALLTAMYWQRALLEPLRKGVRASIYVMMGLGFLLALVFSMIPWTYNRFLSKMLKNFPAANLLDPSAWNAGPYVAAMVLLVGMAVVGYFGLYERRRAGVFWAAGVAFALVALIAIRLTFPLLNRYFIAPPQELAYTAGASLSPSDPFIVYGSTKPSAVFYAQRKVIFVDVGEENTITTLLRQPGKTMVLLPEPYRLTLPPEAEGLIPVMKQYGYVLLSNQPKVTIREEQPASSTPIPAE